MNILFDLVLLTVLLFLAAVTAASEISMIASSRIKLKRMAMGGSGLAKLILKILEMPERFFGTILVTNNVIGALIAVIIAAMIIRLMGQENRASIAIATLITSFLIIVSEVTAKTIASRHPEKISLALARPIKFLIHVTSPVVKILEAITEFLAGLVGAGKEGKASLVTEEEIRALIKIGEAEGAIHKEKYRMLSRVFDFSETLVNKVMTSKADMTALDINSPLDGIIEKALESGYSRFPVYKGSPDNIIGMINMKDLVGLLQHKDLIVLQDIIYPATTVAGTKKVTELLKEFQKGHTHFAVVVDEAGRPEGLVTLEDLLEEIVGEIEDEYDIRTRKFVKRNPD